MLSKTGNADIGFVLPRIFSEGDKVVTGLYVEAENEEISRKK